MRAIIRSTSKLSRGLRTQASKAAGVSGWRTRHPSHFTTRTLKLRGDDRMIQECGLAQPRRQKPGIRGDPFELLFVLPVH
jgi:hypothetical protein